MRYWIELFTGLQVRYLVLLAAAVGSLVSAALMSVSSKKIFRAVGIVFYVTLLCSVFYIIFMVIRRNCMGY